MALNKNNVDIIFTEGVNNKTDNKLTLNSSLLALENRRFIKTGALDKRLGFNPLSSSDCNETPITTTEALSVFNDELVMFADSNLYSYSSSIDRWVTKDKVLSAAVELSAVVNNSKQQTDMDFCQAGGVALFAWKDSETDDLLYSVQDVSSGSFFVQNAVLSATGAKPRCIALGNTLFVFFGDSTALKFLSVSATSPCAAATTGTMSTGLEALHADHLYDLCKIGITGYVFYKGTTAATMQMVEFNTGATVVSDTTLTATIGGCMTIGSLLASDTKNYIYLAYRETASVVRCAILTRNLTIHQAVADLDATASTTITKITLAKNATDSMRIFYQTNGATVGTTLITSNTLTLAGVVGTRAVFLKSVGIASRAFNTGSNLIINVLHESELQATVFTVNELGSVVCVFSPGNSGSHSSLWAPTNVETLPTGEWAFPMNVKGVIRSENATLFSLEGLSLAKIDFQGPNIYNSVTLNSNMYAVGGILNNYDGQNVTEQGFHLFPEGITSGGADTTGGDMSDGVYQFAALYRWVDNKGNIHQSAPSIPLTVTMSGGGTTQTIDITVPTLRLTQKTGVREECTIEIFRTEDSGSIFYKQTSVADPLYNDATVDTVTVTDTYSDASIIANEILYITGDVLDNISAPSCSIATSHQNRLFIAGLQDKNEIRYSKIVRKGEGVAFNEALAIFVDPKGGNITNLASMDSNLIILKRSNLYRVSGDGPSDTGAGGTFTEPELISTDVGCTDSNSVVLGPSGLFFKSAKGIYLLDRSLTTSYIGAPVEDFNAETITSAVLLDSVNEVRFTTNNGNILVYNYFFDKWSVYTGHNITDALVFNDEYTFITTSDLVFQEYDGYRDNGGFVGSKVATGWIRLSGIQGYQRAYRISVLGEFKSKHKLKLTVYNDYSNTIVQETIFEVSDILSVNAGFYGDGVYGAETYGTEDSGIYQFQVHLKKQKCQVFRVVIEDFYSNSDNDGDGEGFKITGLSVEIGSKRGLNKVGADRSK